MLAHQVRKRQAQGQRDAAPLAAAQLHERAHALLAAGRPVLDHLQQRGPSRGVGLGTLARSSHGVG